MEFEFEALLRTAEFLQTPHVLDVLGCLAEGLPPHAHLATADPDAVNAAVCLLIEVEAAHQCPDGTALGSPSSARVAVTVKGRTILRLAQDLDWPPVSPEFAIDERAAW
ncbi:hypothetical protein [Rugosimonospora acidiphila]